MLKIFKIDLAQSRERSRSGNWSTEDDVNKFLAKVYAMNVLQSINNDTLIITVHYKNK